MKKIIVIGISILSVFILCSLSYNPIIAEKPIIKTKEEVISIESEDCGCNSKSIWNFPILCSLMFPIIIFLMTLSAITGINEFHYLAQDFINIGENLGCWWVPQLSLLISSRGIR